MTKKPTWKLILEDLIPFDTGFYCSLLPVEFDTTRLLRIPAGNPVSLDEFDVSDHIVCPLQLVTGEKTGLAFVPPCTTKKVRFSPERYPTGSYVIGEYCKGEQYQPPVIVRDLADGLFLHQAGISFVHVAFDESNLINIARKLTAVYGKTLVVTHYEYPEDKPKRPQLNNVDDLIKAGLHVVQLDISVSITPPPSAQDLFDFAEIKLPTPHDKKRSENKTTDFAKWDHLSMINEISLLYGTDTVWDDRNRLQMRLSHLRHAVGKETFDLWNDSGARKIAKGLEFEPSGDVKPDYINMFYGLPERPFAKPEKCQRILEHIKRLCGSREIEFTWLLKWIAYPLQNLGAKMDSGVIMYGSEGPGKSILWEHVISAIYGEYAITIGQAQLEAPFNGWMSCKCFALCEEVVSRSERNQHKGQLKHMITGKTMQINDKNLPLREEKNHVNSVFLSNSTIPLELDTGDRRYLVLYCGDVPPQQYFADLFKEINSDGVDAFYHYLMSIDLTDFSEHTRPPLNEDKERLIEASMSSPVLFFTEWQRGDTDYPYTSCTKSDLFSAYKRWCVQRNEFPKRDRDVNAELGRYMKEGRKDIKYPSITSARKTTRMWITNEDFKRCADQDFNDLLGKNCCNFYESITKQSDKSRFGDD